MINKFQNGGVQLLMNPQQQIKLIFKLAKSAAQGDLNAILMISQIALKVGPQGLLQIALAGAEIDPEGALILESIARNMALSARLGAKLNYLKKITNSCPEGTQLTYYKAGGQICSKCEAIAKKLEVGGVMDKIKKDIKKKTTTNPNDSVKKEHWDKRGNYIIRAEEVEKRRKQLNSNKTKEETTPPHINKGYKKNENGGKVESKVCPKCGKVHAGKCGSKLMKKKKKCACGTKIDVKKCGSKMKKKHQLGGILTLMLNLKNKI